MTCRTILNVLYFRDNFRSFIFLSAEAKDSSKIKLLGANALSAERLRF
jgi:hypothetical protein